MLDAAALIAQKTPGGVPALAQRMGVSANTLQHKLNPNNATHHLTLREAMALQQVSGLPYVLHAMAAGLDFIALRCRPDDAQGDVVEAFMRVQLAMGEFTSAAADAQLGHGVTRNALRRVEHQANEAMASISHLVSALAAQVPNRLQE
ncbi:phage regulatory CII family protein [Comamonas aquatica]|uniref:phage regulatory CII family protein n=1 Tax=Comamonas aquatica TaxID=225991 RepID=UPI00244C0E3B|nr:phage regulatory CII family protein [Comamonas aquatica]MDH1765142.1 phage regulatory CII family protein [Comamonas aquatica]